MQNATSEIPKQNQSFATSAIGFKFVAYCNVAFMERAQPRLIPGRELRNVSGKGISSAGDCYQDHRSAVTRPRHLGAHPEWRRRPSCRASCDSSVGRRARSFARQCDHSHRRRLSQWFDFRRRSARTRVDPRPRPRSKGTQAPAKHRVPAREGAPLDR